MLVFHAEIDFLPLKTEQSLTFPYFSGSFSFTLRPHHKLLHAISVPLKCGNFGIEVPVL